MHPQPRHPRRWVLPLAVVVGVVAAVVLALPHEDRVSGRPTHAAAPPHELVRVAEIPATGYPKEEGDPSLPDEQAMEIHGDMGYVATYTETYVHVTAFRLTDGKTVWRQDVQLNPPPTDFTMVATDDVLLVRAVHGGAYVDNIAAHDLQTGEILWSITGILSEVVANRILTYDVPTDTVAAVDLTNGKQVWSTPGDQGRSSEFPQQTAKSLTGPRDLGDDHHLGDTVATNTDKHQYLVQASMYSGAVTVFDLASGKTITKGTVGDKVTQLIPYEDTIYVYRRTAATLTAYPANDLTKPRWTVPTSASQEGALLDVCAKTLLCLKTITPTTTPIRAVNTETGKTTWQTAEFPTALPPTTAGTRTVLSTRGHTMLLDPTTGKATRTFDTEPYALPGNNEIIGTLKGNLTLIAPTGATTPLGPPTGEGLSQNTCEWTQTQALCADKNSYQLWRYRG